MAVNSGTAALQIAIRALGIGPGDEVIIPAFTIISCALAVIYAGATPVLVDADPSTWTMDVDQIEAKITSRTRAILAVHVYGHPADMDRILELSEHHGLQVIEDAAEAHGAEYLSRREDAAGDWRRCGGFGSLSCFSFYANKAITTGEGGMIVTDDADLAREARSLRNLGFGSDSRFEHRNLGFSARLTNVQAAIGLAQTERVEEIITRKKQIGHAYGRVLKTLRGVELPAEEPWSRNVYWMFGLMLSDDVEMDGAAFARELDDRGIETRPFFLGMHEQPVLHELGLFGGESYPVSERLSRRGVYLPSGVGLSDDEIAQVCGAVEEVLS